jgi:proton glutamate symport protein
MKFKLHTLILMAMVAGVLGGMLILAISERTGMTTKQLCAPFDFIGKLFLRLLRMIVIPLILASIVTGVQGLGTGKSLGRIGGRTLLYYTCTTFLAVAVGLVLVSTIKPGVGFEVPSDAQAPIDTAPPTPTELIFDMIPDNPIGAMAKGQPLPVIVFALLLGIAISRTGERAKPLARVFESLNTVVTTMVHWIMVLAPIGMFALMANTVGSFGLKAFKPLSLYMGTVLMGLGIHAVITLPLLLLLFARISPLRFFSKVFSAVAMAFSTSSSAATMPLTLECLEENVGVSRKVTSFVIPLGATVNMDGTALYEAVAAVFIAQAYGIDLSLGQQIMIMVTATLASIGAAAIPSAGLFTMIIVLNTVNLPIEGMALIVGVDRILDMCRTAVNLWGDSCGTAIIAKLEGDSFS